MTRAEGTCFACRPDRPFEEKVMAAKKLDGVRVAILATDGFEQSELEEPRKALDSAGAETKVVSPVSKPKGWSGKDWGDKVSADVALADARADDFDALLLPGGVHNPDALRIIPEAVAFVKAFFDAGKPIAAICHGPWTVLEAGAARGRRMTSWPSLKTDLTNAGAEWVDAEVVVDQNLVTSRNPDYIPAFTREMIGLFARQPVEA
jgi:protease I